jgi:polyisoprenoid-binding protein YceI
MRNILRVWGLAGLMVIGAGAGAGATEAQAQTFKVDPVHSAVVFRIHHFNAGMFWGRFNAPSGTVNWDAQDPTKSTFDITIPVKNLDTGNAKRDQDLSGPDFFNSKQYTDVTFKSTSVRKAAAENTYEVAGDLTLKGVTKPVTATIEQTGIGKGTRGETRAGFEATFTINRKDFGVSGLPNGLGDEVKIIAGLEGVQQ